MPHPKLNRMSDPRTAGAPSPEEMRAYLEQLRDADPAGLVAEAFNLLATGAQVKLGRPDARVLIDAILGMVQSASDRLPAEITQQMEQGVANLQVAQVQAEQEATGSQASGSAESPGDEDAAGGPETTGPPPSAGQRMTDRLWVPGRDPGPPAR